MALRGRERRVTGAGHLFKSQRPPAILIAAIAVVAWPGISIAASSPSPAGPPSQQEAVEPASESGGNRSSDDATRPLDLEELSARATAAVTLIEIEAGDRSRQGSGFLVDPEGLVLTNYHVIRGATNARVRLSSGDFYDRVAVMATDERRDLAILKISGFGLPTLPLGNSDEVRIGTDVVAIGSPMGLENTVSTGIISGRRTEPEGFRLLQITAPASTGSSGGPVLDRSGHVIGIAASQFRNGQNLNFAVPVNYARGMLAELDGEPLVVLGAAAGFAASERTDTGTREMGSDDERVNEGLEFDLSRLQDHELELVLRERTGAVRRTHVTYRRIEDIAGGEPRLERYAVVETTLEDDSASAPHTIRRERHRSLMSAEDLSPVSARGEIEWLTGSGDDEWRRTAYDLRFADDRVTGTVTDGAGVVRQVDREVPTGTLLRSMRHVAFATLEVDTDRMIGRSMELHTFDAETAEMRIDRFDIRNRTTIEAGDRARQALVVDVASGLVNERHYFTSDPPRRLLRRQDAEIGAVEEVVSYRRIQTPDSSTN